MQGSRLFAHIRNAIEFALDVVVPRRLRTARTTARDIRDIPLSPRARELLGVHVTTIMEYKEATVQDLIRALKYDGSARAAHLAAVALADYLREEIAVIRQFSTRSILLVPVPLHRNRVRERGFNQIDLVVRTLPREFRDGTLARYAPQALARTRATKPQTRLPRTERIKNIAGAFAVSESAHVSHAHVFLIDDVATTGATLKSAGMALEKAGAEVSRIALACA